MNSRTRTGNSPAAGFRWVRMPPSLYGSVADPRAQQLVPPTRPRMPGVSEEERGASPSAEARGSSSRRPFVALFAVLLVASAYGILGSEGNDAVSASTLEGGVDSHAVVAAERREHAALATLLRRRAETAASGSPASAPTEPESREEQAGSPAQPAQETKAPQEQEPQQSGGDEPKPRSDSLTLPVLGETPLPEPELPVPLPEVEVPSLDPAGLTETDPETLLP